MNAIKLTYITLGATLLFSSCSQEEIINHGNAGSDRRIIFHTALPAVTTRSQVITKEKLTSFQLTAFNPEDENLINKETGHLKRYIESELLNKEDDNPISSEKCSWPEPGREGNQLDFFAFYPPLSESDATSENSPKLVNNSKVTDNGITLDYKMENFSVAEDITDQIDFLTAHATGSMEENLFSGISLTFRHQLSRIEVKAKGSHKSCDIEIAGVRITNVPMQGNFEFQTSDPDGTWTGITKGNAEYIFREGDAIVTVGANEVSILGGKIDGSNDNCALLIPTTDAAWDYTNDVSNSRKGIYLNVLLRIIDKTPTTGKGKVQYPYYDNSQGLNAMNIPREYFAIVTATSTVSKRLYKNGNDYYSDTALTQPYTLASGEEIREYGWAALPVSANWQPGYSYSYTLDYTYGVGVHGPDVTGNVSPKAGDPIISDIIGVTVSVNEWQGLNGSTTHTVEVPGA
ncbi:MAG: fimbrillin family protein [Muribaculaceae bacterium]|nr:fimbrillin family protein [Muribaculaceae bacterium]